MLGATGLSQALKNLGFNDNNSGSYDFMGSDPLNRYLTSFLGGAIGGPAAGVIEIAQNYKAYKANKEYVKAHKGDLYNFVDLVRKYGKEPVLKALDKYEKKNLFPTTLSLNLDEDLSTDTNPIFKPSKGVKDSQNSIMFDFLRRYTEYWDSLIHQEGLDRKDDDSILSEVLYKDDRVAQLKKFGLDSIVAKELNKSLVELANADLAYKNLYYNTPDTEKSTNEELKKAAEAYKKADKKVKDIMNGAKADDFLQKTVFELSRSINSNFYSPDIFAYSLYKTGKSFNALSKSEQDDIKANFEALQSKNELIKDLSYTAFKTALEASQDTISQITGQDAASSEKINKLLEDLKLSPDIELSDADKKTIADDFRNGRTDDQIIEESNLNAKGKVLTDTQKANIVQKLIDQQVEIAQRMKIPEGIVKYFNMGFDVRFYGDNTRTKKLVQGLKDLRDNDNIIIDAETKSKLSFIRNYLLSKDMDRKGVIDKYLEKHTGDHDTILEIEDLSDAKNSILIDGLKAFLTEVYKNIPEGTSTKLGDLITSLDHSNFDDDGLDIETNGTDYLLHYGGETIGITKDNVEKLLDAA